MSKSKNQNKNNNKSPKVPVKSQPMKPQKGAVIKPIQVTANKNNQKTVVKSSAKPVAKVVVTKMPEVIKKQIKPSKKEVDIAESGEDEDEDDIEFDSDIDDVDLGDSDDEDNLDEDDDDDLSIEEIDDSDLESFEDNVDSNEESVDDDDDEVNKEVEKKQPVKVVEKKEHVKVVEKKEPVKVVEKKAPVKAVEKKEPVKSVEKKEPVKSVEKKEPVKSVEKKEPVKPVEKKQPVKSVEKKENTVEKVIDPTTKEGKVLMEINKRKNYFNDVIVFVSKIPSNFTREYLMKFLKENNLSVITINLPGKISKKGINLRGYGFVRFANVEDTKKAVEILNTKEFDGGKKIKASSYVCRKVYDDINKVNFCKLIVQTFTDKDVTAVIEKRFTNVKVTKMLNTQYVLEFSTKEEATKVFNEETVTIEGNKMVLNYIYALKSKQTNETIPEIVTKKELVKPVEEIVKPAVKAPVKRTNCESSSEDEEEIKVVKKTKMNDGGSQSAGKVEKKVFTPKKSMEVAKTPEKKNLTPQSNKGDKNNNNNNKSPANGKAQFNKSPFDKKKQFNNNKQQSPAGKKGDNSPGNKKFNSPGNKKFNSPGNKKFNSPGNKKFNKK